MKTWSHFGTLKLFEILEVWWDIDTDNVFRDALKYITRLSHLIDTNHEILDMYPKWIAKVVSDELGG